MIEYNKVDTPTRGTMLQVRFANPWRVVRDKTDQIKSRIKNKAKIKTTAMLVAFFEWALDKRGVQQAIAAQLSNSTTPLCRVLNDAVQQNMTDISVNADDVEGLDRYIEDAISEADIDASCIRGFDRAINEAIENAEIEADKVSGLEGMIDEMLKEHKIDADNIEGLDTAVRDCITNDMRNADLSKDLTTAVRDILATDFRENERELADAVCKIIAERLKY